MRPQAGVHNAHSLRGGPQRPFSSSVQLKPAGVIQRVPKAVAENVKDRSIFSPHADIGTAVKDDPNGAVPTTNLMVGFGEAVGTQKWRTQVKWGDATPANPLRGTTPNEYGEDGTWMEANPLGPDHPMGSGPSVTTQVNSNKATRETGITHIAGHLLNDNLGGSGADPRNIVAIPEAVNKLHCSQVEELIKTEVNINGHWVYYRVDITHGNGTNRLATHMQTRWHLFNDDGTQSGPLHVNDFNLTARTHAASPDDHTGAVAGTVAKTNNLGLYDSVRPLISTKGYLGGKNYVPTQYPHIAKRGKDIRPSVELEWDRYTHPTTPTAWMAPTTPLPDMKTARRNAKGVWVTAETIRRTNSIRNSFVNRWKGVGRDVEGEDNPFLYGDGGNK